MKKLFAFDIDGTILNEGEKENEKSKEMISIINKNNDIAILATGRGLSQTIDIAKYLDIKKYIICVSGSVVHNIKEDKTIVNSKMPLKIINYFLELAKKCKRQLNIKMADSAIKYYFGKNVIEEINSDSLFWKKGGTINPKYNNIRNFFKDVDYKNIIQISIKAEPELIKDLYIKTSKFVNECDKNFDVLIVSDVYLEVVNKNISKYTEIEKIRISENISEDNVYVFGDSSNDIEMIEKYKNGIAVSNAEESVKKVAKILIDSCENNGTYKFINELYNSQAKE